MQWTILDGLAERDARELLQTARRRTFTRGEVVFHRGDPADTLHLVAKGRFAVRITTPLADTATLSVVGPGGFFGEMALLEYGEARSATVAALEDGETRSIHKLDFDRLRAVQPKVADVLVNALAARVHSLSELLVDALYVPADRRVLRRLHELSVDFGSNANGTVIPLTQEELATFAGTSRATVNRVLRDAERRGEVALERGRTVLTDVASLKRRAG